MPWRAPGFAPSMNPCGKAGAFKPSSGNPAEVPAGHHQYDNGTALPALLGNTTVWKAGHTAEVAWAISANHGGGYQYRVCPKTGNSEPTEECFQAHVLPFAESTTTIHYTDASRSDFTIPAIDVTTGVKPKGFAWRKNPIPMCNCDLGQLCHGSSMTPDLSETLSSAAALHHIEGGDYTCSVDHCPASSPTQSKPLVGCKVCDSAGPAWSCSECCDGCNRVVKNGGGYCVCGKAPTPSSSDMYTAYEVQPGAAQRTPECPTGLQFPNLWDEGYGDGGNCLYPQGANSPHCKPYLWTMVDKVRVPTTPGDYYISFRWDCEHTPQVWNQCADIRVEA